MNETTRAKSSVLAEHDTLQAVQAPTPRVLTIAVTRGLHTVLSRKSNTGSKKIQIKRGLCAKRATITRGPGTQKDVPEVSSPGTERVSARMDEKLEGSQG